MRCVSAGCRPPGGGDGPTLVVSKSLPDTSPEDVAIVTVHHYPLPVERVLIHGAGDGYGSKRAEIARESGGCSQIASGVIGGDVSTSGNVVRLGMIRDKAWATGGRTRERIVRGR